MQPLRGLVPKSWTPEMLSGLIKICELKSSSAG